MNRGDKQERIFVDDEDRRLFLATLGQACAKTEWQVHAFCLMSNHFHLVVETPRANLSAGIRWFLGTYTGRYNRRHRLFGHLFRGRFKALNVDAGSPGYLKTSEETGSDSGSDSVSLFISSMARFAKAATSRSLSVGSFPS
jgi:REP element-mobilizing transposase RayT